VNCFWLVPPLAQLGRIAEAREALNTATTVGSRIFDAYIRQRTPFMRQEDYDHILDGLHKAGWSG